MKILTLAEIKFACECVNYAAGCGPNADTPIASPAKFSLIPETHVRECIQKARDFGGLNLDGQTMADEILADADLFFAGVSDTPEDDIIPVGKLIGDVPAQTVVFAAFKKLH